MKLINHDIKVGYGRTDLTLRLFGDVHKGADGHDSPLWYSFIHEQEKDKRSYCIGTGDLIDADRPSMRDRKAISYADGRKEAWTQEDKRNMAWLNQDVIPDYKRIAKRCLGLLDGDHFILFSSGMTSTEYICKKTGIPYLGERMAYVAMTFHKGNTAEAAQYVIFARHGKAGGGTTGNSVNALEKQNIGFGGADLFVGGHNHKEHIHPLKMLYPNRPFTQMNKRVIWYVRGGSFLKSIVQGKTGYPEKAEYNPLCQGWGEVELIVHRVVPRPGAKSQALIVEAKRAVLTAT